jgi:parallel beta-helix repeat protein
VLAVAGTALFAPAAAARSGRVIVVRTTIQAAVDAARPGDTIWVPRGVYRESVQVTTSRLTIAGGGGAVIDARGHDDGIRVGRGSIGRGPAGVPVCPPVAVRDVTVRGLTVRNAQDNGIFLIGVDRFRISGGRYVDNHEYGVFPSCSRHGRIDHTTASGANDTGIYVGNDSNVLVEDNRATGNTSGFEVENSHAVTIRRNVATGNTAGILAFVLPNLPMSATDHVTIAGNVVTANNRPNPVAPDSGEDLGVVPAGTGMLLVGADDTTIERNVVRGNNSLGLGIIANPFAAADPRIQPTPDRDRVLRNVLLGNGRHPDPVRATTPGADAIYDGSGTGTCFAANMLKAEFPAGVTHTFGCPRSR